MVGSLLRFGSVAAWVFHIIACMGPKLNSSLDEIEGQNSHAWRSTKATLSEEFWTTSTCNMDNTALQSCGSISSTSTLPQYDAHGAGCSSMPSEFVNHGLILWNQNRQKWIWDKKPESRAQQLREPKLSWNATYDSLLSNNKPFEKPVPLGEMVDFLVDIWEQEGMYD
ncbi:hypothetical protein C2S52_005391 [Perilla frutescens var. hirtella]|nr:hypothetical protein C2S51_010284 [Perilla frutescens var. frutescens]KAH6794914.1 hypothetical protein C2S52_005391 [Perilla frutescens var. hirtella]KAH6819610.1 hypothetical protein C2S51_003213 [Perilla frutescens var. frutescens]